MQVEMYYSELIGTVTRREEDANREKESSVESSLSI
jgi:hypothetical protein